LLFGVAVPTSAGRCRLPSADAPVEAEAEKGGGSKAEVVMEVVEMGEEKMGAGSKVEEAMASAA